MTLFTHSAIEEVYYTFSSILEQTGHYQRRKQLVFITVDVTVACLLVWLPPKIW